MLKYPHMATKTYATVPAPVRRGGIPASWIKAAGILRKSTKQNIAELAKTRRDWEARMRKLEKIRRGSR